MPERKFLVIIDQVPGRQGKDIVIVDDLKEVKPLRDVVINDARRVNPDFELEAQLHVYSVKPISKWARRFLRSLDEPAS